MPGECTECGRLRAGIRNIELEAWNFHKLVAESEEEVPSTATECLIELICQMEALLNKPGSEARP